VHIRVVARAASRGRLKTNWLAGRGRQRPCTRARHSQAQQRDEQAASQHASACRAQGALSGRPRQVGATPKVIRIDLIPAPGMPLPGHLPVKQQAAH